MTQEVTYLEELVPLSQRLAGVSFVHFWKRMAETFESTIRKEHSRTLLQRHLLKGTIISVSSR